MKTLNYTLFLILFLTIAGNASAQLSGTKTIGGASPDYATIQAAVTALQTSGVNGPVIMNIRPGTYQGKVDLGNVSGTSAVNTVTFKSENDDSTSVIIQDSTGAPNYVFHIFGTDFLTVRNLTIRRFRQGGDAAVFAIVIVPAPLVTETPAPAVMFAGV